MEQTSKYGTVSTVKALLAWIVETHREVRSAQSYIEDKHHRL